MDFYALRVRSLWLNDDWHLYGAHTVETHNIYNILRAAKGTSLYPNVRSIHLELSSPVDSLKLLLGVASSSLTRLDLVLNHLVLQGTISSIEQVTKYLRDLPEACPSVQAFGLRASIRSVEALLGALPDILHAWEHNQSACGLASRGVECEKRA